jgi:hypothetical protein
MLRPLQQWTCDYCHLVIETGDEGVLEWLEDQDHRAYGFKIVHSLPASPLRKTREVGCYYYANHPDSAEARLDSFLGSDGLAHLLLFLGVGSEDRPLQVISTRELAEFYRRLMLPYYEEARLYWSAATKDGFFADRDQMWPYREDTLKSVTEEYGPKPRGM